MKAKRAIFPISVLLMQTIALAQRGRTIAEAEGESIISQILGAGVCIVTKCGIFAVLFIIVPALAVYIYRTYIRLGI